MKTSRVTLTVDNPVRKKKMECPSWYEAEVKVLSGSSSGSLFIVNFASMSSK
jgi:hypothetical protein